VQAETYPYAAQLNNLILANDSCTQTVFYMTWGRKYGDASNCPIYPPLCTFEGMQGRLRQSYVEMGDDNQALIAPVGEAFKYSRMADSTINLYSTDNSHPSVAGTYLAACTFYATIFEASPVGLSYAAGLNATQAAFLQQIAYQTVFDSLSVWNINEFEPQASFTYGQQGSSPFQIQFTSISNNANSYVWEFGDGDSSTLSSPLHTYASIGTYFVSLIVSNGCSSDTIEQQIILSPFNSISQNNSDFFNLNYQNETLHINFVGVPNEPTTITIFDALGKQIYQTNSISNQSQNINTSQWSKGIYFVQITENNRTLTQKAMIQ
jgi:PKD repeat protein